MTQAVAQRAERADEATLAPGPLDGFVGPKLRLLWNLLNARMAEALEPFGLRAGAFSTMALISANPGCSQAQLGRELGMDKSAVATILDELEARGLAMRERLPQDRRRHALSLTPAGEALMRRMQTEVAKPGRPIREALSADEMAQLMALLGRAHDALARARG
jgi:DNA-binding MarR family transcriptional regulator